MLAHGIKVDMVPEKYGGKSGMTVEETFLPFEYDDENCSSKLKNLRHKILITLRPLNLLLHIQSFAMTYDDKENDIFLKIFR